MSDITQRIRLINDGTIYPIIFKDEYLFYDLNLYEYSILPAWVVPTYSGISPYGISFLFVTTGVVSNGVYTFYFTEGGSPSLPNGTLEIELVSSLTDDLTTCDNSNTVTLVWITREGGRASYIFDQRKDFKGVVGESKTFDNNGIVKYVSRGKNFTYKTVYKSGISNIEADYLESLRYSVQAWEYDSTNDECIPIVLDNNSYDLYNTKNKFNEVSIKYRLAEYKEIQNQ